MGDTTRSRETARFGEAPGSRETSRSAEPARRHVRDDIVSAAREQTIARGWDAVRMADVAAAAGVSRQTVYNEFATKAGLADALAQREIDRFVSDVRAALYAHGDDVAAAAYAAIFHTLREAAGNPLIKAILTSARGGSGSLLPYLTTRAEGVLTAAAGVLQEWAADHLPGVDAERLAFGAESIIRLVVSHIVLPLAPADQTAAKLADLAVQLVAGARRP
jgi:AcrR family transcriptional regulator